MTKNLQFVALLGASGLWGACGSRTDLSELLLESEQRDDRSSENGPDSVPLPQEPGDGVPVPRPTEPGRPVTPRAPPQTPPEPLEPPEPPAAWGAFEVKGPCAPLSTVTLPNSVSDDGRYYVYAERSYNPDRTRVILLDRHDSETSTTVLHEVAGDDQQRPIISGNAELIGWKEGLGNGSQLQLIDRVSQAPVHRTPLGDGYTGVFSGDARYLAYSTRDQDITVPPPHWQGGVVITDLDDGSSQLVSVGVSGESANRYSSSPDMTADGRLVIFSSSAANIVAGKPPVNRNDIYLWDRDLGYALLAIPPEDGSFPERGSTAGRIAANATVLGVHYAPVQQGDPMTLCLRDLLSNNVRCMGSVEEGYSMRLVDISDDGRFVLVTTDGQLTDEDQNSFFDGYVYDRLRDEFEPVHPESIARTVNGGHTMVSQSGDGTTIAFVKSEEGVSSVCFAERVPG